MDRSPSWAARYGLALTSVVIAVTSMSYVVATDRPIGLITRDPNQISQAPAWAGLLSTLGNGMWAAAIGIVVFSHGRLRGRDRNALALLGALTMVLYLDDSLLLHDIVLPNAGIPELVIYLGYGIVGLSLFATGFHLMNRSGVVPMIVAAGVLFGISIVWDAFDIDLYGWGINTALVIEDGTKFVGIALWVSAIAVMARFASSNPPSAPGEGLSGSRSRTPQRSSTPG